MLYPDPVHPELCPETRWTDRWTGSAGNKVSAFPPGETSGREKSKGHFSFGMKIDGKERNRGHWGR